MTIKPVMFLGRSRDDIRMFSEEARRKAGYQLRRLQRGVEPEDWKPMTTIGVGVIELRVRDEIGAWRVICIARLVEAIYVLHTFQKKSPATPKRDLDLATARFKELMRSARK